MADSSGGGHSETARSVTAYPLRFDLVIADPPYTHADAEIYGFPMVNRKKVLHQIAAVMKEGGHLVWLDTTFPMYTKRQFELVARIGYVRSTNHRIRGVFIFRRQPF